MHHHQQDVLLLAERDQAGPQRQVGRQVEDPRGLGVEQLVQPGAFRGEDRQLDPDVVRGQHALVGPPLVRSLVGAEDGTQALVPYDHVGQRRLQRGDVQRAADPDGERDVVGGRRALQLVEEPQPLLSARQRELLGPLALPGEGRAVGVAAAGRDVLGELGDRRVLEEVPQGQLGAHGAADAADQAGGEHRVAAAVEEVVVDAEGGQAEHVREQAAEQFLGRVARRPAVGLGAHPGGGQRAPVELAVGGQRQRAHRHHGGRDHVLDQLVGDVPEQLGGVEHTVHRRDDVRHQALVARAVLADDHGGLGDGGVADEGGLDLAELDPEAAQLDLLVGAAEELDLAVVVPAGQVAGAVHPGAGRAVGVGGEALGGLAGAVGVALREVRARDVQLAGLAGGGVPQLAVQDVHRGVGHRDAQVQPLQLPVVRAEGLVAAEDGRLGRAVDVHHGGVGAVVQHALQGGAGEYVAAGPDLAQPAEAADLLVGHRVEERGGEVRGGRLVAGDGLAELAEVDLGGGQDDGLAAAEQRDPQLVRGGVEGQRRVRQHPLVAARVPARVQRQFDHVAVSVDDALRGAAGAGGEHHVQRLVRVDGDLGGGGRLEVGGDQLADLEDGQLAREGGQLRLAVGDQQGGLGGLEDPAQPLLGLAGVQRDVHAAALQHGQHRHHVGE